MNDSRIPSSAKDWYEWLSKEEQKTRRAYLAKPATLIADYYKELATTRDYEGREILELLQNAADQAREASVSGRVIIELRPEGLIVANTGTAFSIGGVASLQTAHLSPKRRRRRQFIGNKGLGFRAVLNWSHSPIILSDYLALAYQPEISSQVVAELCDKSQELADRVEVEREGGILRVTPVLPFPGYSQTNNIDSLIEDSAALTLLSRCQEWIGAGYTTAIGMPLDNEEAYQAAMDQIDNLRPEILLFVDHLDEVRFVISGKEDISWHLDGSDDAALVTENNEPLGIWQVFRSTGEIPSEKLDHDQVCPLDFELVVAVPEQEEGDVPISSPLFSHFPTEIILPLPVVCHATLELEQNRKHAQQRRSNAYVLKQLAQFLAEIAEVRAKLNPDGTKAGFRILMNLQDYPHDLTRDSFEENLIEAASNRSIVPTLGVTAVKPGDAYIVPGADDSWLPSEAFSSAVPVSTTEEIKFFKNLGVPELDIGSLKKKLSTLSGISLSRRAALIAGLLEHDIDTAAHTSALLIDTNGNLVPDEAPVFVSPRGGPVLELPDWIELRFLNDDLRRELSQLLSAKEARDLHKELTSFGLLEYSLANLVRRIISAANREKKNEYASRETIERDLVKTLFFLYQSEGHSDKRPEFPDNALVFLSNQVGESSPANTLYLGEGYGAQGKIAQALYGGWAPEHLVASPATMDLTKDATELRGFLQWLKVADWPREITISNPKKMTEYLDNILDSLSFPARFEEYEFKSREELQRVFLKKVRSVKGLEQILSYADPSAIAAWLSIDERAFTWNRKLPDNAELSALQKYDRKPRLYKEPISGYIRWKIENTPWLHDENSESLRPKDCVLGERAIEAILPRPTMPADSTMTEYNVSKSNIIDGWRNAGVVSSLADLDLDDIYARLLELPNLHPDGKSARSLYRWLLNNSDNAWAHKTMARDRFFNQGHMWGSHGNTLGYFPVSELHHIDMEGLPEALLARLKIVDLPRRVGTEKVKRVFNVQSVDRMAITHRAKNSQLSADFDPEFQKAKPYIYGLRSSQTSQTLHLNVLKHLHLKVCSEINVETSYEGETFESQLPVWGSLIDREENLLYIRSDPAEPLVDNASALLADAIGEAIASIFRLADGGEFARMFHCKDKDRKALLRRMRGEAADEDMEKIMEEFSLQSQIRRLPKFPKDQPIPDPPQVNESTTSTVKDENVSDSTIRDLDETSTEKQSTRPLNVASMTHEPTAPTKRENLRIKKTTSGSRSQSNTSKTITDGDFAERKVVEFEGAAESPRFPLRVGQITGHLALGCDVLSFASEQDREDFVTGDNRDLGRVLRFIEVKGRKNEGGSIELRGNEKSAATEYGNRYYLYRLHESTPSEFVLSILQNPLAQSEALEPAVHVNLNRAESTERFEITGGIQQMVVHGTSKTVRQMS